MFDPAHGHADMIGEPQQHAEAQHGPGDDQRRAEDFRREIGHQAAGDDHRRQGDENLQAERPAFPPLALLAAEEAAQNCPDIAVEIDQHGAQRADMDGDVDIEALILPTGQAGQQN